MRLNYFSSLKKWRIGDYFRQFSIVTAGIMVTFIGSNMITNYATEKEVKATMNLIVGELEKNNIELSKIITKYEDHRIIAGYLIQHKFNVQTMSADTLQKYQKFISTMSSFDYSSDALDVLKGSSLMQKIEDKDLLMNLIEAYQGFSGIQSTVKEYYDLKESIIVPVTLMSNATPGAKSDIFKSYENVLANVQMKNFCMITIGFFNPGYLEEKIEKTNKLVERLKKQYQ